MRKINILYVTASKEAGSAVIGGGELHLISLIKRLDKSRFHVCVIYPEIGQFSRRLQGMGIESMQVNTRRHLGIPGILSISRLVKEKKIDIVHAYDMKATLPAMLARAPHGLFTAHQVYFPKALNFSYKNRTVRTLRVWRDWLAGRLAHRLIAVSDEIEHDLISRLKVPASKVVRIYNGVDVDMFDPLKIHNDKRAELGLGATNPVVGMVARLEPLKGHQFLLGAAAMVVHKAPQVRFLIVGEGWQEGDLKSLAGKLGLDGKVIFTGFRNDIPDLYAIMDIVVLPSLAEGMNLTVIEAMLMARPLVVSNIPGLAAMVKDGVTGFTFPPKDSAALAKLLLRLIRDRELACRLGQNGRRVAIEHYNLDQMVAKTEKLYLDLMEHQLLNMTIHFTQ